MMRRRAGGGFASAVTAFMGQNFGARRFARIRRGFRVAMAAILGWEAAVTPAPRCG